MRLLIAEDDKKAANTLKEALLKEGFQVDVVENGVKAFEKIVNISYTVLIIDCMMPEMDGFTLVKKVKDKGIGTPILMLTALSEMDDKLKGFSLGVDDYVAKPYVFAELLARLGVLIRRGLNQVDKSIVLKFGDVTVDKLKRSVTRGDKNIDLQPREFDLLCFLAQHQNQTVTRQMLLEAVWGYQFDPQTNLIDVHISRLRNKVDSGFEHKIIKTIRGIGYKLVC